MTALNVILLLLTIFLLLGYYFYSLFWEKVELESSRRSEEFKTTLENSNSIEKNKMQDQMKAEREKLLQSAHAEIFKRRSEFQMEIQLERKRHSEEMKDIENRVERKILLYEEAHQLFSRDFLEGRKWLAKFIAESEEVIDNEVVQYLSNKPNPAPTSAAIVKKVKQEKRQLSERCRFLEYHLETIREYFPVLRDYENEILSEYFLDPEGDFEGENESEDSDRVKYFLTKQEYDSLSTTEKNQLALDRFKRRHKSKAEIGRSYERYLGHTYEGLGWEVKFFGAIKGYEDLGRDLICRKNNPLRIEIVQAKCWSSEKTIFEKHVFQTFGTAITYELENSLPRGTATPVLISTTEFSPMAKMAAKYLGVRLEITPLPSDYPMIKCNVNNGNKIYHLPFDQLYDRVKIANPGEIYVSTVIEAEKLGFRRAKRFFTGGI